MNASDRDTNTSISQDLQELGFTDYEARIYVALLTASPATAYEIGKNHALPRPNVYSALEGLERKGAVQRVSSDPVRYVPLSPKDLLERIASSVTSRCATLRERLDSLKPAQRTEYVWNLSGTGEAHAKIEELIAESEQHIWIKSHHGNLEPHVASLKAASARGVSILLVLFGSRDQIDGWTQIPSAVVYAHEADGTVVGLAQHLVTLTVDFKVALITNLKERTGAHTRSTPVVNLVETMIRHEIYLAEIFAALGKELEQRFGPALLSLRKIYLPEEQARALEQHLSQ